MDLHDSGMVVDLIEHKILVDDHFTVYRIKRIDLTHLWVIAQFCDLISHLFQYPAGRFGIKARKIPGNVVQVLHGKG